MLQFISAFGLLGFGFILLAARRFRIEHKGRATLFGILSGLLLAIGGVALYAALRVGTNAAVVTTVTSLYPMCTVILAVFFLRERLTKKQLLGLALAIVAIVIFSL